MQIFFRFFTLTGDHPRGWHSGNTGSTPVFGTKIKGIIGDSLNFDCLSVFFNAFLFQAISAIIKS